MNIFNKINKWIENYIETIHSATTGALLGFYKIPFIGRLFINLIPTLKVVLLVTMSIWLLGLTGIAPVLYNVGVVGKVLCLYVLALFVANYTIVGTYKQWMKENESIEEEKDESKEG